MLHLGYDVFCLWCCLSPKSIFSNHDEQHEYEYKTYTWTFYLQLKKAFLRLKWNTSQKFKHVYVYNIYCRKIYILFVYELYK
jgi:hypothetical protein